MERRVQGSSRGRIDSTMHDQDVPVPLLAMIQGLLLEKFDAPETACGIWPGHGHPPLEVDGIRCEGLVEKGRLVWAAITWRNGFKNTYKRRDGEWVRVK